MARLKRVDSSSPGIHRRRRGRGFSYVDDDGEPVEDDEILARIASLVIPPAWKDVWISVHPMGHIQAIGTDDAGRKQYRYHDKWRERRDAQKFEDMISFARSLPKLRRNVKRDIGVEGLPRDKVLACAVRLLDVGAFRIGSEDYAEKNESYGLATIRKEHATVRNGIVRFEYPSKSGQWREQAVRDADVCEIIAALRRRRGGSPELLAYREGRHWRDLKSDDVNGYLKEITGGNFSAKDFRTWNATALAAIFLADRAGDISSRTARKRTVSAVVKEVARYLGNTPAVCRASYIDPRVIDRYEGGLTIARGLARKVDPGDDEIPSDVVLGGKVEAAVLDLIAGHEDSPRVEEIPGA